MAKKQKFVDHLGNEFPTREAILEHYNVSQSTFYLRKSKGLTLAECLGCSPRRNEKLVCFDHLGNKFASRNQMLKHYGLSDVAYLYRLNKLGWSLEKTLTTPPDSNHATAIQCTDHLGNTFASKADMCAYWGIPRAMFFRRIRKGWSQEDALSIPPQRTNKTTQVQDHLGNNFASIEEMCKYWNISKIDYVKNIRNNYSKEDALTKPTTKYVCKDHLGNTYSSINEMCRHYGITKTKLRSRLDLGWTLAQILEQPEKINHHIAIEDHLGNKFKTQKEMLEHYGIAYTIFKHRQKKGLSLEECLTDNLHKVRITDHEGHAFDCLQDFCNYWHKSAATWHHHHNRGKSNKEIVQTISVTKYNSFGPDLVVIKKIKNASNFYEISLNGERLVWSTEQICDYDYRRTHNGYSYNQSMEKSV